MNILHATNTFIAGAPLHISNCINKYTKHKCRTMVMRKFTTNDLKDLLWNFDYISPSPKEIRDNIEWANVLHYHIKPLHIKIDNEYVKKPSIITYESEPKTTVSNNKHPEMNGNKYCIAQYHWRFYKSFCNIIPNIIDINDNKLKGNQNWNGKIKIFFGYASECNTRFGYKGSREIISILNQIKSKRDDVEIYIISGRPFDEVMEIKRKCHIVIGDIKSGSYHLSELEGLSQGACVFNNIDNECKMAMKKISRIDHPFIETNHIKLYSQLWDWIRHKDKLKQKCIENRKWIEKYWNPEILVNKYYIPAYEKALTG